MMNLNKDGSPPAIYRIFGLDLISAYPFSGILYRRADKPDPDQLSASVYFACAQIPPFPVDWEKHNLVYFQGYRTPGGLRWDKLYHFEAYDVFRFSWGADYYLSHNRIDCHLYDLTYKSSVELFLMGIVLAFWLEREGYPALHASAVVLNGKTVAFPCHSGHGKSTLASAFLQEGATLLTDDILPIEQQTGRFWGRPGLPQINLWPDQTTYFIENNKELEKIVPDTSKKRVPVEMFKNGMFCDERQPLTCVYMPSKSEHPSSGSDIDIIPVSPAEAVIELVRYSFISPIIFERLGWQARRLEFFARLVERVPVRRLTYPSGFEHLPRVTEAVVNDLEKLHPN